MPSPSILSPLTCDLVWWEDEARVLFIVELTVCNETNLDNAAARKTSKYTGLVTQPRNSGYRTTAITLQVGSRGVPDYNSFIVLAKLLKISTKDVIKLFKGVTEVARFQSGVR